MPHTDSRRTIPREASLRARQMTLVQQERRALVTQRNLKEAEAADAAAQKDLVAQVAEVLGLLTHDAKELLRPFVTDLLGDSTASA